jgi:hypothetical protein
MDSLGLSPPGPIPPNRDAWTAFVRVCHVRHYPMGQAHLPNWSDIESILTVHKLWSASVQEKLNTCFTELMKIKAESDG